MHEPEGSTPVAAQLSGPDKASPLGEPAPSAATLAAQRTGVLDGQFPLPLAVLKRSALEHNLAVMRAFCDEHGVALAPHGKTTMAPQLVQRQLEAGAWGVTVATIAQARLYRHFGIRRLLLANQLVDHGGIAWAAGALADPEVEFYCLLDGLPGLARLARLLRQHGPPRPLPVLIELGVSGRRAGCRSTEEAESLARGIDQSPWLELAGVEGFEGVLGNDREPRTVGQVDAYLDWLARVTERLLASSSLADRGEVLVSAGGSAYPDRVVQQLRGLPQPPVRVMLRSGSYLTHDCGLYAAVSPLPLTPALEVWAPVLSRPEPDLAIVGFGRRDASFDAGLPTPRWLRDEHGDSRDISGVMVVRELNDQHALVTVPAEDTLTVGDLMGCGISHPCTTLDKWSLIPLVDDDYRFVDLIRTFF